MKQIDLATMLKIHDWFYDYSDDPAVYRGGLIERMEIMKALEAMPRNEAKEIILKHAPKEEQEKMLRRLELTKLELS